MAHLLGEMPHLASECPHLLARYYGGEGVRSFLFRAGPAYDRDETESHLRIAQLLITNGADPNFPASHKETIVSCAARHDHKDNNGTIVAALIDAGGRWTVADLVCAGLEERLIAAIDRDPELVNRHGPLPGGITGPPLHAGLHTDFFHHEDDREVRMMAVLLKRGADIHAEDGEGCTVFGRTIGLMQSRHDAIVAKAKTVRSFLLDQGAEPPGLGVGPRGGTGK